MITEARIPFSYVAQKVRGDATYAAIVITLFNLVHRYLEPALPDITPTIAALVGTAISLILSFKMSQSYDRWWEARKIWGAIVNDSRTLARKVLTFPVGARREQLGAMVHRQIAWCHVLGSWLRGLDWRPRALPHLSRAEADDIARHDNPALALLQLHGQDVSTLTVAGQLTDFQRISLEDSLTRLTDWMGMAERIRNTVFPRTYRIFLHSFIYVFVMLLSLSLTDHGAWGAVVTFVIAVSFFLLEKTATHMQDPFRNTPSDTPVTAIATSIEINLLQLLGETEVPRPEPVQGFFLM